MNIDLIKQKAGIIGESDAINQVLELVAQVANVDISVLINGESGTGKELVSKALHLGSKRASSELVIVNCGAIPEGIIESELFGHKKGLIQMLQIPEKDTLKQLIREQFF